MANVFKRTAYLQEELFFFKKELGGTPCFFLDTDTGHLSDSQLEWLKLELNHLDSPLSFSCTILPFMVVLLIWIKRIILVNLHEYVMNIPLIIYAPWSPKNGKNNDHLISQYDFPATRIGRI